ncbi:hypothetical protein, partial [Streptomyces chryseus]|uniref:hypothetical protein n=1 Tax=Streptomyces chryseus TaxID=68186 RepID=UPI001B87B853
MLVHEPGERVMTARLRIPQGRGAAIPDCGTSPPRNAAHQASGRAVRVKKVRYTHRAPSASCTSRRT